MVLTDLQVIEVEDQDTKADNHYTKRHNHTSQEEFLFRIKVFKSHYLYLNNPPPNDTGRSAPAQVKDVPSLYRNVSFLVICYRYTAVAIKRPESVTRSQA